MRNQTFNFLRFFDHSHALFFHYNGLSFACLIDRFAVRPITATGRREATVDVVAIRVQFARRRLLLRHAIQAHFGIVIAEGGERGGGERTCMDNSPSVRLLRALTSQFPFRPNSTAH